MLVMNDQQYTLGDLEQRYEAYAKSPLLQDCGHRRIAVCAKDPFEWLSLCLYIRKEGGSVVPIHPSAPKEAALRLAKETNSHVLLFSGAEPILLPREDKEESGVLVQMSSGTTGEPKCIERSWHDIAREVESYAKALPVSKEAVPVIACPITHSYGLISGVLTSLERGVEPVIVTNPNPKYLLSVLRRFPQHLLYAGPALLYTIARLLPKGEALHAVMTSGAPMPQNCLELLYRASQQVLQQYGCSEAGCATIQTDMKNSEEIGLPLPHLKVLAGTKEKPEEIRILTAASEIYTKDLGYVRDDGVVCFVCRMDDMINVAGLNVYPQEVEHVLLAAPHIEEAVVYKKRDDYAGERVCVQFVASVEVGVQELRKWCRERLAPHQMPAELVQVAEIAKLPNGKVSRRLLEGCMG